MPIPSFADEPIAIKKDKLTLTMPTSGSWFSRRNLPSRLHTVGYRYHDRMDPMDLAVFDLDESAAQKRSGTRKAYRKGGPIGQRYRFYVTRMIEKRSGRNHTAFFIDGHMAPAYPGDELEIAGLKLLDAAEPDNRKSGIRFAANPWIVCRLNAILQPVACFSKRHGPCPVHPFQRLEIAVGDDGHIGAGGSFGRREYFGINGIRVLKGFAAEELIIAPCHNLLNLRNLPAGYFQSNSNKRRITVLLDETGETDLPGRRIGKINAV